MLNLAAQTVALAAAIPPPSAPSFLKTAGITGILVFFVGILIIWKGTGIVSKADKQDVQKSMKISVNVIIGIVLIVVGLVGGALPLVLSALGFFTTVQ